MSGCGADEQLACLSATPDAERESVGTFLDVEPRPAEERSVVVSMSSEGGGGAMALVLERMSPDGTRSALCGLYVVNTEPVRFVELNPTWRLSEGGEFLPGDGPLATTSVGWDDVPGPAEVELQLPDELDGRPYRLCTVPRSACTEFTGR